MSSSLMFNVFSVSFLPISLSTTAFFNSYTDDTTLFDSSLSRFVVNLLQEEHLLENAYFDTSLSFSSSLSVFDVFLRYSIDYDDIAYMDIPTPKRTSDVLDTLFKKEILTCSQDCYICLDRLLKGTRVRVLTCGHSFCIDCIDEWFSNESHVKCPVCSKVLFV